ncbi:hypothetical protein ACFSQ7_22850 [Paenibacillus rhizoplanae]
MNEGLNVFRQLAPEQIERRLRRCGIEADSDSIARGARRKDTRDTHAHTHSHGQDPASYRQHYRVLIFLIWPCWTASRLERERLWAGSWGAGGVGAGWLGGSDSAGAELGAERQGGDGRGRVGAGRQGDYGSGVGGVGGQGEYGNGGVGAGGRKSMGVVGMHLAV